MNWLKLLSAKRLGSEHRFRENMPGNALRSEFEIDFDRIIFSHPFRRLQDKTQVVPLPEHDFVHTRLTHSLEVSSVGRSLGKHAGRFLLEKYPELREAGYSEFDFGSIVAAACLVHDIGNPPFGHSGEKAISSYFTGSSEILQQGEKSDLENFEGNAQGFRILCSPQYPDLKLTYATLASFVKYPCESHISQRDPARKSRKKFGFFQSEKEIFLKLAEETGLISGHTEELVYSRHPLVFLVEAADDICYLIIDLEDAVSMGSISFEKYVALLEPVLQDRLQMDKLQKISNLPEKAGLLRALAINKLVEECVEVFCRNETGILSGDFDKDLISQIPSAKAADEIAAFSFKEIYRSRKVLEIQAAGYEVLPALVKAFYEAELDMFRNGKSASARHKNLHELFTRYHPAETPSSAYSVARTVVDFVSGMTDRHAIDFYRKIHGIST